MRERLKLAYRPIRNRMEMEERLARKAAALTAATPPLELSEPNTQPEREQVPLTPTASSEPLRQQKEA